ncbi:hypothetical protein K474DRAFT_767367 [Panus rudis PR-1116 ss-1]|nr:hypothetical protein K474DRAFT_767367 [Panus rudis PR-1116 ss-1]
MHQVFPPTSVGTVSLLRHNDTRARLASPYRHLQQSPYTQYLQVTTASVLFASYRPHCMRCTSADPAMTGGPLLGRGNFSQFAPIGLMVLSELAFSSLVRVFMIFRPF